MMIRPTILLVGGAWHAADYLAPLARVFENAGYPTQPLGLPSAGAHPPAQDFSMDVSAIRHAADRLITKDNDVIAVLHSLGGIAGTEALHGLSKTSTNAGLLAIVYIAAMVPQKGNSFEDHLEACGDSTWKPARKSLTQDGMLRLPPEFAMGMLYNDIDETHAKYWTSLLKPQSVGVYNSPLTHETYKEVPSGYIMTTKDKAFKHDYQLTTVKRAGFPNQMTLTLDTGHTPWFSKAQEVRDFVLHVAKQTGHGRAKSPKLRPRLSRPRPRSLRDL